MKKMIAMNTATGKKIFSIILIAVSALFLVPFLHQESKVDSNEKTVQSTLIKPTRLKIPSINVDVEVGTVGLTPDGAMEAPDDPLHVAWFSLGTLPGEKGSAVIAGHWGWKNGIAAIFDNLDRLRKGDKIYVEDGEGKVVSFEVKESREYDKDAYAPEVFKSEVGVHLNLVTCVGDWDKSKKSYSKRLVVFADMVP